MACQPGVLLQKRPLRVTGGGCRQTAAAIYAVFSKQLNFFQIRHAGCRRRSAGKRLRHWHGSCIAISEGKNGRRRKQ